MRFALFGLPLFLATAATQGTTTNEVTLDAMLNDVTLLNNYLNIKNPKPCVGKVINNLIVNGDFQDTTCTAGWCAASTTNNPTMVKGWTPNP